MAERVNFSEFNLESFLSSNIHTFKKNCDFAQLVGKTHQYEVMSAVVQE